MWYEISQPIRTHGRRLPKWALRAYQHEGRLFVPAALGASEQEVMLCASYDGVRVCMDAWHVYVEAEWLARNYPKTASIIARCLTQIKNHASSPTRAEPDVENTDEKRQGPSKLPSTRQKRTCGTGVWRDTNRLFLGRFRGWPPGPHGPRLQVVWRLPSRAPSYDAAPMRNPQERSTHQ